MNNTLNTAKKIAPDFIWRAFHFASRQGINFAVMLISVKLLSPEEFGIYSYVVAFAFLFTLISDFGISRAVTKFVAQYKLTDEEKLKSVFFNSAIIIVSIVTFLIIVLLFFSDSIVGEKYSDYLWLLIPFFLFVPLTSLFDGIYIGLKEFKKIGKIAVVSALIVLPSAYFLIKTYSLTGSFLSLNLFYTLFFILIAVSYKHYKFELNKEMISEIGKYSLIVGVSGFGMFLYTKANTIILGKYDFIVETGYYEFIDKVFAMITIPFIIFGQILSPKLTELVSLNRRKEVFQYFKKTSLLSLGLAAVVTAALYFLFPLIVSGFLPKYDTENFMSIFYLIIFNLPLLIVSAAMAQPFLVATGEAKYSLLTIPFGILNISLALIFINLYGFIGVVIATLISSIAGKLLTYYLIFSKFKN
ncbi:MAG: oligosaccharide flippase family protein [Chlorobi bacterium]|nr:oligosaccharide flippase family protein [Chlorobiota bacterium]